MRVLRVVALGTALLAPLTSAAAQAGSSAPSAIEAEARLQRNGGGVRGGSWNVRGLTAAAGNSSTTSPLLEGYLQKGLDLHLALENTLSVWRWRQAGVRNTSGGLLGGSTTTREQVDAYVVPFFTSVKLYPVTRPGARLEPYLLAGAGLGLGIEDRSSDAAGGLYGGGSNPPSIQTGFGFKGGVGVEWRFSKAFGLTAGARYQYMRMFGELAGREDFQGVAYDGGIVYRFQYR